jgi:glycosyltransferase involved in cell wall biosynthesis
VAVRWATALNACIAVALSSERGEMTIVPDELHELPLNPINRGTVRSRTTVVHIVTRYLHGGSERRVVDIVGSFPEAEHHLIVGSDSDPGLAQREVAAASLTVLPTLVRQPDPWRDAVTLERLIRFLRNRGCDLVITHQSKAGVLGRTAAWLCRVPAVHSLSMASFGDGYPAWQSRAFRWIESGLAHVTAAYAVGGADLSRRYAGIGVPVRKLHIVRSGVPLPPAGGALPMKEETCRTLDLPVDRSLILYLGSLDSRKNVLDLPSLLGRLIASNASPRPHLVVAGDGHLAGPLQQTLSAAGLAEDAKLLGFVSDPLPLVAIADVLVLLSSVEGVPQVLVQASALGTPFVAYAVDGVEELIDLGADGVAVAPGDLDAAASATLSVLRRDRRACGALIDLSSWAADTITSRYRRVIGAVLTARSTRTMNRFAEAGGIPC